MKFQCKSSKSNLLSYISECFIAKSFEWSHLNCSTILSFMQQHLKYYLFFVWQQIEGKSIQCIQNQNVLRIKRYSRIYFIKSKISQNRNYRITHTLSSITNDENLNIATTTQTDSINPAALPKKLIGPNIYCHLNRIIINSYLDIKKETSGNCIDQNWWLNEKLPIIKISNSCDVSEIRIFLS